MRFRKRKEEELRLGLAPLVDIVFLLLFFFMVSSHFDVASGVRLQLPRVGQKIFNENKDTTTLFIDKSAKIYLEGKKVDIKTLEKRLKNLVNKKGLSRLILQADKDVKHGRVVEIIDLAKTAGVRAVIIAARWKSGKVM